MSRDIKFRVWDNEDYMSDPFTLTDLQEGKIKFTSDCVVMQSTEIKDKNGVEMYQGDICKHHHKFQIPMDDKKELETIESNEVGTIEYKGGAFGFVRLDRKSSMWGVLDAEDEDIKFGEDEYWFEVIGNIHENPQLLEEAENE